MSIWVSRSYVLVEEDPLLELHLVFLLFEEVVGLLEHGRDGLVAEEVAVEPAVEVEGVREVLRLFELQGEDQGVPLRRLFQAVERHEADVFLSPADLSFEDAAVVDDDRVGLLGLGVDGHADVEELAGDLVVSADVEAARDVVQHSHLVARLVEERLPQLQLRPAEVLVHQLDHFERKPSAVHRLVFFVLQHTEDQVEDVFQELPVLLEERKPVGLFGLLDDARQLLLQRVLVSAEPEPLFEDDLCPDEADRVEVGLCERSLRSSRRCRTRAPSGS